jgi:hypothetical protein
LDCLNCLSGLEVGDTGKDIFVLTGIGLELRGEGTVVENPVKFLALTPISLRGAILLRDGSSLLDCNNREGRIRMLSI